MQFADVACALKTQTAINWQSVIRSFLDQPRMQLALALGYNDGGSSITHNVGDTRRRRTHHLHDGSFGIAQGCRPGNEGKAPLGTAHLMQKRALIAMQYSALHHRTWKTPTVQKPCSHGLQNKKAMKSFDFTAFSGAMEGTRTPGLLIRSQSLYPAELPTHTFRSEHDVFYHSDWVLSTVFCKYFYLFQKAAFFMIFLVSFLSFLCYNSFTICF